MKIRDGCSRHAPSLTWHEALTEARRRLGSVLDAERIAERASGRGRADLAAHGDSAMSRREVAFFDAMVGRRAGGEPLQYVVGRWGFRRLELLVDRRVLIPRPETETVVEVAMDQLEEFEVERPIVVDLGTGSGAIALSIATEVPAARVWASDVDPDALAVARANLAGLGSSVGPRVRVVEGDWFEALPSDLVHTVDLVVANPPYVGAGEVLPPEVSGWEPRVALVSGPTGLEAVQRVLAEAPRWLAPRGAVVLEIAPHQAEPACDAARLAGFHDTEVRPDLAGRPRVLTARLLARAARGALDRRGSQTA